MNQQPTVQALALEIPIAEVRQPLLPSGRVVNKLKAERIQEKLKAAAIWNVTPEGTTLWRVKRFPTQMAALQYASFATSLASGLGVPVAVRLTKAQVSLTFKGPLQDGQLDLAVMLS